MKDEYQLDQNKRNNRINYIFKRDIQDREAYKEALKEVEIRNRHLALMNEVRNIVNKILSR